MEYHSVAFKKFRSVRRNPTVPAPGALSQTVRGYVLPAVEEGSPQKNDFRMFLHRRTAGICWWCNGSCRNGESRRGRGISEVDVIAGGTQAVIFRFLEAGIAQGSKQFAFEGGTGRYLIENK